MSDESTVSTTQGFIDVANVSQDFHTSHEQNDNDVLSQAERSEFLRYPRNFFDRITGAFQKMKKQLVVCGHIERVDKIMAVVFETWCQPTVGRC